MTARISTSLQRATSASHTPAARLFSDKGNAGVKRQRAVAAAIQAAGLHKLGVALQRTSVAATTSLTATEQRIAILRRQLAEGLGEEDLERLVAHFHAADLTQRGALCLADFNAVFRAVLGPRFDPMLFHQIDANLDGAVDVDEFLEVSMCPWRACVRTRELTLVQLHGRLACSTIYTTSRAGLALAWSARPTDLSNFTRQRPAPSTRSEGTRWRRSTRRALPRQARAAARRMRPCCLPSSSCLFSANT